MTTVAEPKKARKKPAMPATTGYNTIFTTEPAIPATTGSAPASPKKPGDPGFDWAAEYPGEDVFVFTASTGVTVGLAAAAGDRKLKPGDFRKMSHMEPWAQNFYLIEKVSCPKALAISDNLDDEDYAAMMQGWTEWSGSAVGES